MSTSLPQTLIMPENNCKTKYEHANSHNADNHAVNMQPLQIFESPDGGETVYVRQPGSVERTLYSVSPRKQKLEEQLRHSKLWGDIHRAAQNDPVLKNMLDQIEVYHRLRNSP